MKGSEILPGVDNDPLTDVPPRFENSKDRIAYLLAEYRIAVMLTGAAVVVLLATGRLGIPEIPDTAEWMLQWFAIGLLPACFLAQKVIVEPWIPDPRHRVLEINLDDESNVLEMDEHLTPRSIWSEREQGETRALEPDEGEIDYIVTDYEWDEELQTLRVDGANEEIADPTSILAVNGKLDEVYNDLAPARRAVEQLKARNRMQRDQIEAEVINAVIGAIEHGLELSTTDTSAEQIIKDAAGEDDDDELPGESADDSGRTDEEAQETLNEVLPPEDGGSDGVIPAENGGFNL